MAIIAVRETKREGGLNKDGVRRYRRIFDVETDVLLTGALEVMIASGIPLLWQYYITEREVDLGATVRNVDPQQDEENPYIWHVTVEYSSEITPGRLGGRIPSGGLPSTGGGGGGQAGGGGGQELERNPLLRFPEKEWSTVTYQEPIMKARVYNPATDTSSQFRTVLVNSANTRFDPVPEGDRMRWVLTYSRNKASFSPHTYDPYRDTVNSTAIWGFPKRAAHIASIRGVEVSENDVVYWKETFQIQFRTDWRIKILDMGFQDINKKQFQKEGKTVSEPVALTSAGLEAPAGTKPSLLEWEDFDEIDYGPLQINPF